MNLHDVTTTPAPLAYEDEEDQAEVRMDCPNCQGTNFYRVLESSSTENHYFNTERNTEDWGGEDRHHSEVLEDWKCNDCGDFAPEHVFDYITYRT